MAIIYELHICNVCHNKIGNNDVRVPWENLTYCEPCFDEYVESIEPSTWKAFKDEN